MKKTYILLFLASVFSFQMFAQNKKGDKLYKYYDYSAAIPFYLEAVDAGSSAEQEYATQKLADCYRLTNNAPKAKQWYEKVVMYDDADPMNYFYLGQALRSLGSYEEAESAFEAYNKLVPDNEEGQLYYQYCIDIQEWQDLPPSAEIKNIEALNTKYSDFCPVFYRDGIVFTSDRKENKWDNNNTYGWTNFNYLNLFYTIPEYYKVYWNGVPEPKKMSRDFNQSFHDGPVCFSSDYKWIYITRTVAQKGKKLEDNIKTHLLRIYFAEITGDKSPDFKPFPYNSEVYSVGHPALSKDAQKIIFSSDMPGGFGGSDLYMCVMENGTWSKPVNLGDKINSKGDEVFPYWADGDVLFYSSDGFLGYGGLDLFQANMENGEWTEPENLKAPLNSSYDDFGIVVKENLKEGMFSSNRPEGRGHDDIYGFKNLEKVNPSNIPVLQIQGRVVDLNNTPVPEATVFLLEPLTNKVKVLITDDNGRYTDEAAYDQAYVVKAMKDGYMNDCTSFRTPAGDTTTYNVPRDLVLVKLEVNQVFKVENIYYDLDKWYIRKDAEQPLDNLVRIMKQYPITAELSSHTDCRASDEYNNELSQKRAESAVRYIILQGIDLSRIVAKGYGESRLVNKCSDGVDCTEEEHQANRRTEFKITSVGSSSKWNGFDLSRYREGDTLDANTFDSSFFTECTEKKEASLHHPAQEVIFDSSDEVSVEKREETNVKKKSVSIVDNEEAMKIVYRVQLIATQKELDIETYFSKLDDIIQDNEIHVLKVGTLNKYQIGNFQTITAANRLKNTIRQRGYKDCFISKVDNKYIKTAL